ncbi:superoxide dismutase [Xanthomonas translucens pv. arrhenatheri]|uniref:Superoxide dismutase [Cu-Zn] n=1 Tax=Xanthomonas graminis pv. arrhenatheri LMG 727 TaxID=1195923 RepID=A0A0K2ZN85_9XANT|nr:superoxide dismutase family protein [Xanthomonas translucens]OAX67496.1 superoxide dismutase [Xanthomonas translucens pv. arrhenatheri]UKE77867.1 superoxide dismutase family protein [Xanthomonas translucens pv. arrhenatheri]CTP86432.1 superoxide dismutase [Xanthomonas translucens pv. arrhenatheri LMG 727]
MRTLPTVLFLATTLALGACKREAPAAADAPAAAATPATTPAPAAEPAPAAMPAQAAASAALSPTQGNQVAGEVKFETVDGAVHVTGTITGLKPNSEHGFHIHEFGDCSAPDGSSAGGHFNPAKSEHGQASSDPHHGGDMPNLKADADGKATIDAPVSNNVNIGKGDGFDILNHAVIVHADPDDYKTQPTGNAGGRLACGVIKGNATAAAPAGAAAAPSAQ